MFRVAGGGVVWGDVALVLAMYLLSLSRLSTVHTICSLAKKEEEIYSRNYGLAFKVVLYQNQ